MKLLTGLQKQGKPYHVASCDRKELPKALAMLGKHKGVEIGVFKGELTEQFCRAGLTIFGVDPWLAYKGAGKSGRTQSVHEANYLIAKDRLSAYPNCRLIRKTSVEALALFRPESLDYVYIDGDHRFGYVAEDIYHWYWKVKRGGIIAGHDYYLKRASAQNLVCQVKPVVDAFIETFAIPSFYTFGTDKYLSWLFFK